MTSECRLERDRGSAFSSTRKTFQHGQKTKILGFNVRLSSRHVLKAATFGVILHVSYVQISMITLLARLRKQENTKGLFTATLPGRARDFGC